MKQEVPQKKLSESATACGEWERNKKWYSRGNYINMSDHNAKIDEK